MKEPAGPGELSRLTADTGMKKGADQANGLPGCPAVIVLCAELGIWAI